MAAIDPTTQAMTLLVRGGDFTDGSDTWAGTASTGTSGGRDLAPGTTATVGEVCNGYAAVRFTGSGDFLESADSIDTFIGTAAYSGYVVFKTASAPTLPVQNPISDYGLLTDEWPGWTVAVSDANFSLGHYDGNTATGPDGDGWQYDHVPYSVGSWTYAQFYFDGAEVGIRVNGGAWTTFVATTRATIGAALNVATGFTAEFSGDILEIGLSQAAFSHATFDGIGEHLETRYGISIGFTAGDYGPTVGSPLVNGYAPADYNGIDQFEVGTALSDYFGATAWSVSILAYARTAGADPGATQRHTAPCLISDDEGKFCLAFTSSGVTLEVRDTSGGVSTLTVACQTGAWKLIQASGDGTNLKLRVGGATFSTASSVTIGALTGLLQVGCNPDQTAFFDGQILEIALDDAAASTPTFLAIGEELQERYALTLGMTTTALAGSATSSSSTTASLTVERRLAGSATSASGTSAALTAERRLAGSATSSSSTTAALATSKALAGTAASVSSTSAALTVGQGLAGTASSASSTTGALTAERRLSGTAASASSTSAALSTSRALAGSASSESSTTAALSRATVLAGVCSSTSDASASLSVPRPLSAECSSTSTTTAALTMERLLAGVAASTSDASASLARTVALVPAAANDTTSTTGALTGERLLSGTATSTSSASGTLGGGNELSGAATSVSDAFASLTVERRLAGIAASSSDAGAALSVPRPLAGTASSISSASASLTKGVGFAAMAASVSLAVGSLTVERRLAGSASSTSDASGSLNVDRPFAGTASSTSLTTGALTVERTLAGTATSSSATSGHLSRTLALEGLAESVSTTTAHLAAIRVLLPAPASSFSDAYGDLLVALQIVPARIALSAHPIVAVTLTTRPLATIGLTDRPVLTITLNVEVLS